MNKKQILLLFVLALALIPIFAPKRASAQPFHEPITTPDQLINAVNGLRLSRGLSALEVHSALMQSAQSQAAYMAATGNVTHERPGTTYTQQLLALGFPLAGDLSLGGLRSENILSTGSPLVWNGVPDGWQDDLHMNTMLAPSYTHIGAGISQKGGLYYYALDAAAATGSRLMQDDASAILTSIPLGSNAAGASQYIIPVELSAAQPDGDVYHVVEYGQSLWAIAIAYDTKIKEIQALNNLGDSVTLQLGQKLLVKRGATQPAPAILTPTMMVTLTPIAATPAVFPSASPTLIPVSPTPAPAPAPPSKNSSGLLVGVLIFAALIGGGVAVWLIRDPN
ncbi:MAG: CAP domain-containing protein [Anaerolineales bacterium]|nr:CAP domain-containing protein [Anaerolineales bacterium]